MRRHGAEGIEGAEPIGHEARLEHVGAANSTARFGLRLQDHDVPSGVGQQVGGHQAVGAGTDHDGVRRHGRTTSASRAKMYPSSRRRERWLRTWIEGSMTGRTRLPSVRTAGSSSSVTTVVPPPSSSQGYSRNVDTADTNGRAFTANDSQPSPTRWWNEVPCAGQSSSMSRISSAPTSHSG